MAKKKKTGVVADAMSAIPQKVPKTVQDSIPYERVYDDSYTNGGIIESKTGYFTKSYNLFDANYSDAGEEMQESILEQIEKIFATFSPDISYEITVNNRSIDQEAFHKKIFMAYRTDKNDDLRMAHNELLLEKEQEGKNNIKAEKYLTVGVYADAIKDAVEKFVGIEKNLSIKFKKINMEGLKPFTLRERLNILHDIYNYGKEDEFERIFDMNAIISQGLTTKDIIGPASFNFKPHGKTDRIEIGNTYARVLFLKSIPTTLSSQLIESLTSISSNVLISVHYEAQPKEKAVAFASGQVTNIGGDVVKAQKNLSKSGADPTLISPKLSSAHNDAKELLANLTNGNQVLMKVTLVAVVFADNEDDLELYTNQIKTKAKEHICSLEVLNYNQEQGLNTALPLACNYVKVKRPMTNRTASAIQPFSSRELQYTGGFYYGLNQSSKNLILYNRNAGANQNGIILGPPGTGKSFAAKFEMYQAYLNTQNSQIFIIDPEREYKALGQRFNALIFPIEPGGTVHLNPLDLDITKDEDGGSPLAQKIDFVISIIETMLGGRNELSGYLKGIIDNVLQELYTPYIENLQRRGLTIDTEICPTLKDVYEKLMARKEPESRNLAKSIEMYCTGILDLFAYHTNVNVNNRMVIYDTKNIGTNLQELGLQICLNDVWNRMISNKAKKIRTYFYLDEFYLLLRQASSAVYLQMVWKRARKWMGTITAITQNVEDLLASQEGNTILQTSDFALILNQAPLDKAALAAMYNISEEMQEYITNASPGTGLIKTSNTIIPFENIVPTDSEIYKLLSTKAEDAEAVA